MSKKYSKYSSDPFDLLIEDNFEREQATQAIKSSILEFNQDMKEAIAQLVYGLTECHKDYPNAGLTDTATRAAITSYASGIHPYGSGDRLISDIISDSLYEVK